MKKMFGKRGIALLTTMAILVSLVAMLGGLTLTSNAVEYTPKRTITFTVSEGIQQSCLMLEDAFKVAAGKTVNVKGYYKVDSITGDGFNVVGTQATTVATDGWQPFSIEYTVPGSGQWKDFGFWQASGKFALADITFEDVTTGTVYYDMATDAGLTAGTYTYNKGHGYDKLSLWYVMGAYGTVADTASCTVVIDPVYTAPFEPNRAVTYVVSAGIQQSCFMLEDAYKVAAGATITIKGYYKIDSFTAETTGGHFGIFDVVAKDVTDGWVPFTATYDVPTTGQWKSFGFWEAYGTFSLADITFELTNGTVVYDMATDANLTAGTYNFNATNKYQKQSLWYLLACYGTVAAEATCDVTIDPVYVPSEEPVYTPKRVISMTAGGTQINAKIFLYNTNNLGADKQVKVKGYYKVENYSAWADRTQGDQNIITPGGSVKADCDWTAFEKTITTGSGNKLSLEFWYAQGTVSFADITIEEMDGTYIYDMTADEDLVAGTYDISNWKLNQSLFYFGYYSAMSETTYTIGDVVEGGVVVVPPPYDPELVELPEIPNMIQADKNGYTPNRAFAVINGAHKNPKATYAVFADETNYAVAGNKYYVFLKYRVYSLAEGVSANIKINGTTVLSTTETTDAWVQLLDENGKPYSFEAVEVDDIISFIFDMNGAGCFAIADFIVANQKGEIVYSLANDKTMHIETDMRYISNGYWKGDPYVADKKGPTLFPIQTKCETYKPTAVVSLTQNDKKKDTSAEAFLYFRTNNALFTAGQTYTISGMFKSEIVCGYNGNANPLLKISDSTGAAQIADIANHGTNGNWYPLLTPDGKPVTFKGTPEEDWMKINLYCTYGTVALADIVITDAQGNVVYDMAADTELKAAVGEFTGNVADIGGPLLRHALYKNGVGEVWFAEAAQSNTETSKQIPQFEESVEIPVEDPCANGHNYEDGFCTECGDEDPDYVPPVDDPCANGHNYEDGFCTECGDEDPDYVPPVDDPCANGHNFENGACTNCGEPDPDYVEPPVQTGDESMIFVIALGTMAVISLAVLSLNKKFHF